MDLHLVGQEDQPKGILASGNDLAVIIHRFLHQMVMSALSVRPSSPKSEPSLNRRSVVLRAVAEGAQINVMRNPPCSNFAALTSVYLS